MGKARVNPQEALKALLNQDPDLDNRYSKEWTYSLRKLLPT
jgi:hypothetical protein